MGKVQIDIPKEKIAEFCRRNHIRKLSLFGSVLRGDFKPDSDIDFLVEYEKGRGNYRDSLGLLHLLRDKIFNKEIDIVKPSLIRQELREEILGGIQHAAKI